MVTFFQKGKRSNHDLLHIDLAFKPRLVDLFFWAIYSQKLTICLLKHLYLKIYHLQYYAEKTWHFRFKFPTPARQVQIPHPGHRWGSNYSGLPGGGNVEALNWSVNKIMKIKEINKEALDCETNSPCQHLRNVWRTVWRKCIVTLGCIGLKSSHVFLSVLKFLGIRSWPLFPYSLMPGKFFSFCVYFTCHLLFLYYAINASTGGISRHHDRKAEGQQGRPVNPSYKFFADELQEPLDSFSHSSSSDGIWPSRSNMGFRRSTIGMQSCCQVHIRF